MQHNRPIKVISPDKVMRNCRAYVSISRCTTKALNGTLIPQLSPRDLPKNFALTLMQQQGVVHGLEFWPIYFSIVASRS
jgi:hypothetical protein